MIEARARPIVVDAHHHLWRYNPDEYGWIDDRMALLRRDFDTTDLAQAADEAAVDVTVAVQARQSLQETRDLLAIAKVSDRIAGVVGWLPLTEPAALDDALREFAGDVLLKGARHVVQDEPDGFLNHPEFNAGVSTLTPLDLCYDLLVRPNQLTETARFVDRHPQQNFVLDHLAKPKIAAGVLEPWRKEIQELARRDNISCKLSGLVTEAVWHRWSLDTIRPYLDVAVEAFGTERLLAGSDWPVCLVASGYGQWWQTLRSYFASFASSDRHAIFGGNAVRLYRLAGPQVSRSGT